jgi:hypothetical protein
MKSEASSPVYARALIGSAKVLGTRCTTLLCSKTLLLIGEIPKPMSGRSRTISKACPVHKPVPEAQSGGGRHSPQTQKPPAKARGRFPKTPRQRDPSNLLVTSMIAQKIKFRKTPPTDLTRLPWTRRRSLQIDLLLCLRDRLAELAKCDRPIPE